MAVDDDKKVDDTELSEEDQSIQNIQDVMDKVVEDNSKEEQSFEINNPNDAETEVDDEVETDEEEADGTEEAEVDETEASGIDALDSGYVASARARGFSDEEITTLSPKVLKNLHDLMQFHAKNDKEEDLEEDTSKQADTSAVKKIEYTQEAIDKLNDQYGEGYYENAIKPLVDANNAQAEQLSNINKSIKAGSEKDLEKSLVRDENTFNGMLDKASTDYPAFGIWDKIPKEPDGLPDVNSSEVKARLRMWTIAKMFRDNQGLSMEEATKEAIKWFKGDGLETEVKKNVVKDLANRKKKFVQRPTGKKVKKHFASAYDQEIQITKDAMKKAGVKVD